MNPELPPCSPPPTGAGGAPCMGSYCSHLAHTLHAPTHSKEGRGGGHRRKNGPILEINHILLAILMARSRPPLFKLTSLLVLRTPFGFCFVLRQHGVLILLQRRIAPPTLGDRGRGRQEGGRARRFCYATSPDFFSRGSGELALRLIHPALKEPDGSPPRTWVSSKRHPAPTSPTTGAPS